MSDTPGEPQAPHGEQPSLDEPVRDIGEGSAAGPADGTALCLSGGGYRAMLFHVGVLWRLNDAAMLPALDRISSVSGGSITAGVLALSWPELAFDAAGRAHQFGARVVEPLRRMAGKHVDITSVLAGIGLPFVSVADRVTKAYRRHLFGDATLQDLPDRPRFVVNATNLESGALMRFSKPYLADYRVGRVKNPTVSVASAVAASSAFPPFLSPCTLDLSEAQWVTDEGNDLIGPEYRGTIALSDGGVYDNLGLETAWKRYTRILVSDAGGLLAPDPSPASDWAQHTVRVLKVIDNQVRSLRKRQVIESLRTGQRTGMYIGIRSHVANFGLADPLPADPAVTLDLADTPTRLDALDDERQQALINWGYTICDTGLRAHVDPMLPAGALPYPQTPLVDVR